MTTIYVAILTYVRPVEEIDAQMQAHVAWLRKGYEDGAFLASGRRVPRTGGVILAKGDSLEEVEARLNEDPFQRLGLATVEIIPFQASMAAEAFKAIL
ncbi:YciI family protein [Rhodomicrobium lacus]|jgi:uncharacterized protein YciI|uniref:YciI family protein n=1 Tax=Rhodomicrobium lacus TaxID=2498452 RepID=UPI000F8E1481|nr:YciI family protein [Rhodomicrobium lacus]